MLYIFTGDGKGKTTAAVGTGIRAVGRGLKVFMIQFLKPGDSGEILSLKKIKSFQVKSFGKKGFRVPFSYLKKHPDLKKYGVGALKKEDYLLAQKAFNLAKKVVKSGQYQLLILDEINVALNFDLIPLKEVIQFIDEYKNRLHIIFTGRNCPRPILKKADLITEFKDKKHYFKEKVPPQKGIDF